MSGIHTTLREYPVCTEALCHTSPYDGIADSYDTMFSDNNTYYGPINIREREVFDRFVRPAQRDSTALDVGCGTGFHTRWLIEKGYSTTGIDISREMLRVARAKSRSWPAKPEFLCCNALETAALSGRVFDVIVCLGSTLNHISDWLLFCRRVSAHLRPNGVFLFSCDTFLGIDTIVWLLRTAGTGYVREERVQNFIRNVYCLATGRPFENHWLMETNTVTVEVPLTYETTGRLRRMLAGVQLRTTCLTGVHSFSCFDPDVISASTCLETGVRSRKGAWWQRVLQRCEEWFSPRFHWACANIVGVAVKASDSQEGSYE